MIEMILGYTVPLAEYLFKIMVILIFIIGLMRFYNATDYKNYNKDVIFNNTLQTISAAILIAGCMITLAIIYSR